MSYIELKDIRKSYKLSGKQEFPVLHGINLQVERGEFVSILGESGGGKSTLMNIIGGMDNDYSGDVLINGQALHQMKEKALDDYRKTTVGFIFQSFNLINHMTVLSNVLVKLKMTSLTQKERVERAKDLLESVGLGEHIHKRPNQLSGGQMQRVAIARALASDPDILLADEPTGALDKENSEQIMEILDQIARQGKLVITVTHSQKVADYGTRIIKIDDGLIADDIRLKPAYPVPTDEAPKKTHNLNYAATFKMALDNIVHNLKRNILVTIGGSIGIFSVIIMLALGSGIQTYIHKQIMSNINPTVIQLNKKGLSNQDGQSATINKKLTITQADINKIKKQKHITTAESGLWLSTARIQYGKKLAMPQYFETRDASMTTKDMAKGSTLPGKSEVAIAKNIAQQIDKKHPSSLIGKKVKFFFTITNSKMQPTIVSRELKVSGVFNGSAQMGLMTADYSTLKAMYDGKKLTLRPNILTVKVDQIQNVKSVQQYLKKQGYETNGVGSFLDTLTLYISIASYVLAAIAGISLLVSAIMIIVVLYISVTERTKEIGVLRALGARRKDIRHLFFSEASLLGLFSGVLGVVLAELVAAIGNALAKPHMHVALLDVSGGYIAFGIIVSVVISVVAGLAPSSKAANLDPVESLRKFD
ncbi:MAG: ATP-binding cassette domain-containing protein [Sporolactobacillus sp.]